MFGYAGYGGRWLDRRICQWHSRTTTRRQARCDCKRLRRELSRICPELPEAGRRYFETLREIGERIARYCRRGHIIELTRPEGSGLKRVSPNQ
jgi:hypothetical protein